jgi:hypothetical protein
VREGGGAWGEGKKGKGVGGGGGDGDPEKGHMNILVGDGAMEGNSLLYIN